MKSVHTNTNSRFALRKRAMGSVEATLFIIIGFAACAWCIDSIKNSSGDAMTEVRMRQIATEMVEIAEAARIAGVDLVEDHSLRGTIDKIEAGATARYGVFAGQHYGVSKIDSDIKGKLDRYLRLDEGKLRLAH